MSLRSKLFHSIHAQRVAAFEAIPGPAPTFPLGNQGALWSAAPWESGQRVSQAHGDLALLWMRDKPVLLVGGPELAERVLRDESETFQRASVEELIGKSRFLRTPMVRDGFCHGTTIFAGHSPLTLPAHTWTVQWIEEQLPGLQSFFSERARAFARESMGSSLPLHASLLRVVFSALTRITLGQELSHQAFEDFVELTLGSARAALGFEKAEKSAHLQDSAPTRLLQAIATRVAQARRYPEESRTDLIGHLIQERCALDESQWSRALLQLLISNCQPIAAGLTSTLHLLTLHEEELRSLESELMACEADPALSTLRHLPRLDATYKEGRRLAPPIPLVARRFPTTGPTDWEGHSIPAGTGVLVNLAGIHRHPEHWKEPHEFRPARWLVHQKSDAARSFLPGARGEFAETHQRLDEVITKQILFSWLREHSIMAGDGRPQGFRDRLIQGARIPHWVEARLYQRRGQPVAELADVDAGATDSAEASAEALTAPRQRPAHVLPSSPRRR